MQALYKSLRKETRQETNRQILYRLPGESNFRPAQMKNVSHHGLFMHTTESLQIGEEAEIIISPYDSTLDPVQVTVEVVHIQPTDVEHINGYGCKVTSSTLIENIDL